MKVDAEILWIHPKRGFYDGAASGEHGNHRPAAVLLLRAGDWAVFVDGQKVGNTSTAEKGRRLAQHVLDDKIREERGMKEEI